MAKQLLDLATADSGSGDPIRTGGQKINENFDELYSVLTSSGTAGASVTANRVVQLQTDGKWDHADKAAEASISGRLAITTTTAADTQSITLLHDGAVLSGTYTAGAQYYVGTAGAITGTKPSVAGEFVRVVGYGNAAGDGLIVAIDETYVEVPDGNSTIGDLQITGEAYADGVVTATTAIDWTAGNFQSRTMVANETFTFTAPSGPTTLILKLVQDATGSRTATWPATVKWAGGTAPTLTTTAAAVDIISLFFDGTNYHGAAILDSK